MANVYTISFTMDSSNGNDRGHNARWEHIVSVEKHIDPKLKDENITLVDKDLKQAYKELFQDSLLEYNSKQQRKDRKIKSYYQKVKDDEKLNLAYKFVAQIGGRDSVGLTEKKAKEALKEYMEKFQEANPHLYVTGLYLHADEAEGTFHLHGEFIPWADGYKKGLSKQTSLTKALEQQGYRTKTTKIDGEWASCQTQFEANQRKILAEIARNKGLNVTLDKKKNPRRIHLSVPEYKELMNELELTQQRIIKLKKEEQDIDKEIESLIKQTDDIRNNIDDIALIEAQQRALKQQDKEFKKKLKIMEKKYDEAIKHIENGIKKGKIKDTIIVNRETWESLKNEVSFIKDKISETISKEADIEKTEESIIKAYNNAQDFFDDAVELYENAEKIAKNKALELYEEYLLSEGDDLATLKIKLKNKEIELIERERIIKEKEEKLNRGKEEIKETIIKEELHL